jgi:hypothetical protein
MFCALLGFGFSDGAGDRFRIGVADVHDAGSAEKIDVSVPVDVLDRRAAAQPHVTKPGGLTTGTVLSH